MAKDVFWFKHDSNASRDIKILRLRAIYGWEGYGVYFGLIEILREQSDYKLSIEDSELNMLAILMQMDFVRLKNILNDCIKIGLFKKSYNSFWSDSLLNRMDNWEKKKQNGSKGIKSGKSESRAKFERNGSESGGIREEKRREEEKREELPPTPKGEDLVISEDFESARILYKSHGKVRGHKTELEWLKRKHKDWKEVIPLLLPAIQKQIAYRQKNKGWNPEWKHFMTWLSNRSWEEELPEIKPSSAPEGPQFLDLYA
jgi:hypothetical protein